MDDGPSSPESYIRLVQHLIEKCICYNMNKEECMETLEKHADIMPVITSTVWKELEKENREFFEDYQKDRGEESSQKNNPPDEQAAAAKSPSSSSEEEDDDHAPAAKSSSEEEEDDHHHHHHDNEEFFETYKMDLGEESPQKNPPDEQAPAAKSSASSSEEDDVDLDGNQSASG